MTQTVFAPLMIDISGRHCLVNIAITEPKAPTRSIILIHDLAGRADDFAPITAPLTEMGFRVIAPDFIEPT